MNQAKPHLRLVPGRPFSEARVVVTAEAFNAASRSHPDLRNWNPYPGSADADLLPEQGTIRSRSRDLVRNHGVADGALQTYVDNIIGTGLRMKSRPMWKALGWTDKQSEEWSNNVEALWCAWANSTWCDAARALNFRGLTVQVFRSRIMNGEGLALPLSVPERGAPASTCIQVIESDRLCNPMGRVDDDRLRAGIEFNRYGAALYYNVLKRHPGDQFYSSSFSSNLQEWERIPAATPWGRKRVLHWYDAERPSQSRGKPTLASVLRNFKVLGDFTNAELKAAVVNAKVALVSEGILSQEQLLEVMSDQTNVAQAYKDSIVNRQRTSVSMNDGLLVQMPLGQRLSGFSPGRPSTAFEAFVLAIFRQIAAGLNIPYELLLKDFSKTNYSSARAALLEAWRFFRATRAMTIDYWCQPVYELWLEEMVFDGMVDAPDFYEKRHLYCRTKWIGDGRGWIDPLKEAQAMEKRLATISTMEDECAEQGVDWEEAMEQRSREIRRAKELGIDFEWMHPGEMIKTDSTSTVNQPDAPSAGGGDPPAGGDQVDETEPEDTVES